MNATLAVTNFYFNIGIIFLLRDPSLFNLSEDALIKTISNLTFTSTMFQMLALLIVSYLYDLMGRKAAVFVSMLVQGIIIMSLPFLAPTLSIWLFLFRILIAISAVMLTNSPLIVDYISTKSRGRMGISVYFG